MVLFISTFVNKIDRKGRVSVPAPFRAALSHQSFSGIYVFPSLTSPAMEGCGADHMMSLSQSLSAMDPFSEDYQALSSMIFGESHQLPFDSEGRVVLPQPLMEAIGINENIAFVGKGPTFQLWEPEALRENTAKIKRHLKENRPSLPRPSSLGGA